MNREQKILTLRMACWVGAIIDLLATIQLLIPQLWAAMDNFSTYTPNTTLNFALYIASSLMFGWTLLLIWAVRKPLERKSVLLLTVFPVVFGLAINNIWALASGLRSLGSTLPELIIQASVGSFLIFSYLNAPKENT